MFTKIKALKVKIKSLAAEARIIRLEEARTKDYQLKCVLYYHRVNDVRTEARLSQLAYGFLRGREYQEIEKSTQLINWKRVEKLVEKFGVSYSTGEDYSDYKARLQQQELSFRKWVELAELYRKTRASTKEPN